MIDVIEDGILRQLIAIAGEIVALQALGEYAMEHDFQSTELEDHMITLRELQADLVNIMSARIVDLAAQRSIEKMRLSSTYGKASIQGETIAEWHTGEDGGHSA